jgi:hypothetical protein
MDGRFFWLAADLMHSNTLRRSTLSLDTTLSYRLNYRMESQDRRL